MSSNDDEERHLPAVRDAALPANPTAPPTPPIQGAGGIISYAMQQLTGLEGHQEIIIAAQREGLRLEAKRLEGVMDSTAAQREMDEFIEQAKDLAVTRDLDFDASANFDRASGTTRVTVRRKRRFLFF